MYLKYILITPSKLSKSYSTTLTILYDIHSTQMHLNNSYALKYIWNRYPMICVGPKYVSWNVRHYYHKRVFIWAYKTRLAK